MTKEQKIQLVGELSEKLAATDYFYVIDSSTMSVAEINSFRQACFDKGIEYKVAKNTLIEKALDTLDADYAGFKDGGVYKGMSGIMFSPESAAEPAKVLKAFLKDMPKDRKIPVLKAASIDSALFVGEDQLEALSTIKSKNELIGDVVGLLQAPATNVLGALQSGGQTITGILKSLEEREG